MSERRGEKESKQKQERVCVCEAGTGWIPLLRCHSTGAHSFFQAPPTTACQAQTPAAELGQYVSKSVSLFCTLSFLVCVCAVHSSASHTHSPTERILICSPFSFFSFFFKKQTFGKRRGVTASSVHHSPSHLRASREGARRWQQQRRRRHQRQSQRTRQRATRIIRVIWAPLRERPPGWRAAPATTWSSAPRT